MLSLIASLVVLLMEKQQDIYTLYSFGVSKNKIKNIFFLIGVVVTVLGVLIGTVLGRLVCYLQDKYEIIQLGTSSSFLQAYPVKVYLLDIIMIQLIVLFLGTLTSYLVSRNKQFYNY
jgi:lipoprotein-releasing system permease protein